VRLRFQRTYFESLNKEVRKGLGAFALEVKCRPSSILGWDEAEDALERFLFDAMIIREVEEELQWQKKM